ncbi:MAG: antibiotic biosynthesis monooxygenase [Actinobacteria bacterium]|nr:antibiotic biosynthesis monooxygenase [Actinomycetota bacterium]
MVVTMLQAQIDKDRSGQLIESFEAGRRNLPEAIRESFLLHELNSDLWRIMTIWESREALDRYRTSEETPGGVLMFRSAGAEPDLAIFDVEGYLHHA